MAQQERFPALEVGAQDTNNPTFIGRSEVFRRLLRLVDAVACNDCMVLLEGESGTGKELVAKRIHRRSRRADGPFIPVNCPGVAESLFESQFYGHVKGSFTGAAGDTLGMVRSADGGTLFLDEIGELPIHLQPKLLRLLQEREVTPVGAAKPVPVNVRFIAASNRPLAEAVRKEKFRLDLYHRLNVVRVRIPALRHRREDIKPLLEFYLNYYAAEYGMDVRELDPLTLQSLYSYAWPGNVRELCCWVERLYAADLPPIPPEEEFWEYRSESAEAREAGETCPASVKAFGSLAEAEIRAIQNALAECKQNRSAAARKLNIHRTTLLRKMKQYNLL
ncbi:MAG: sigma-54-dependent Fis family transcriptional regulator [Phycisphaerae bacterium]|nr:sigma-54-dependent Fis family transcriptional regulator [Phycisphaerae bacterium]